jgi:hypothetical protein
MNRAEVPPASAETVWDVEEARLERRVRAWAIPCALALAFLAAGTGPGRFLLRVFLSMWVHEVGHAAAAWVCGYPAFPGPWFTPVAQSRSGPFALLVFAAIAGGAAWAWRNGRRGAFRGLVAACTFQLFCTAVLPAASARQLIYFMGDGGCLVLGTALMLAVYAPEGGTLRRGWLRWGFLVIGAAAFADAFGQWWAARTDAERIPFGMTEGRGLSDPSMLAETYGWSADQLVHRYVALGCVCLAVLAAAYLLALRRER